MKTRNAFVGAAVIACSLLMIGCAKSTDPDDPSGDGPLEITVSQLTGLPSTGGDATAVAITNDGSLISIIDGRLHKIAAPGEAPVLFGPSETHMSIAVSPSGMIYTTTDKDIRVYSSAGALLNTVPYPSAPLVAGRRVESARFVFSPTGVPFVVLVNNYPSSFIYHTQDNGATWSEVILKSQSGQNAAIQTGADIDFLSNGDLMLAMPNTGMVKSSDLGVTWTYLPGMNSNGAPRMLVTSSGSIYTWIPGGGDLRMSTDNGNSFTVLTQNNTAPFFTDIVEGAGGTLLAVAGPLGLMESTNGGTQWTTILAAQGKDLDVRGSTIAVANTSALTGRGGGVLVSADAGAKWQLSGTKALETCDGFAFDRDNNLMIAGGNTLFRRQGSTWYALGVNPNYINIVTTTQGQIISGAPGALSYSGDNGLTWIVSKDFPGYPVGGLGSITIPVMIGRRTGDFLLSVCTYRDDLSRYVSGMLYKVGASGLPVASPSPSTYAVTSMLEDLNGNIYASTELADPFTGQFSSESFKTVDGGASWTKTADVGIAALAVNSQNTGFSFGGDTKFILGPLGSSTPRSVTLKNFTSLPQYIKAAKFGSDDRLYLLTLDKGIFVSDAPVR